MMNSIYGILDMIFAPFISLDPNPNNPIFTIFMISTLVALLTTLANKFLVDQDRMEEIRVKMKAFQEEMREVKKSGDSKAMEKMQQKQLEMMSDQKEMMTMSFKPMLVTMLPILIVFWWMAQEPHIAQTVVMLPKIAYYCLLVPLWHMLYQPLPSTPTGAIEWLGWYVLCSFAMSQIFRKIFGLKTN